MPVKVRTLLFSVILPLPAKLPLKVTEPVLLIVNVVLSSKVPVPFKINPFVPLMLELLPTIKLLASVGFALDVKVPPFNSKLPVPSALVGALEVPSCTVPLVKVTVPV